MPLIVADVDAALSPLQTTLYDLYLFLNTSNL